MQIGIAIFSLITGVIFVSPAFADESSGPWRAGVANTDNFTSGDSVSVQYVFDKSWIQTFGSIPKWEKNFDWNAGAAWLWIFSGTKDQGFHLGPLAGGGESNKSAFYFMGVAVGAHYTYDRFIVFAIDMGPTLSSYKKGRIVDFEVEPFGGLLGLSIHFNL